MHHYRTWGERSHSSDKAMCLEKKSMAGGGKGEGDYFEPEMRVISVNILCWEGSDRLGKGVCCPGSGNRRNVMCSTTTHRAAGLCQPDS